MFSGEAPESDDEILAFSNVKLGAAQEVTEVYKPSPKRQARQESAEGKSILQKILGNFETKSIYSFNYLKNFFIQYLFEFVL